MNWKFNWQDEDPVALVLLIFFVVLVLLFPWQHLDLTKSLKVGPEPVVETPEGGS